MSRRHHEHITDLLDRLEAAGRELRIPSPPPALRAAYRSAISQLITGGGLPEGYRLKHTGRDRGDMVIRLVSETEASVRVPLSPVPMPQMGVVDEKVRAACQDAAVSDATRDQMMQIVQGLADEARRRGYSFTPARGSPGFTLTLGEDSFDFSMYEEFDEGVEVAEEDLAAAKYSWQRVSPRATEIPSGRLALRLGQGYGSRRWADRQRWTLADKLPQILATVESKASAARDARQQRREAARQRRERWDAAVSAARTAYVEELNRRRLTDQAQAWRRASDLRSYADAVRRLADTLDGRDRDALLAWAHHAELDAERLDPLCAPHTLRYELPDKVDLAALDPFMPPGMSARRPPEEPWSDTPTA